MNTDPDRLRRKLGLSLMSRQETELNSDLPGSLSRAATLPHSYRIR